MNVLITGGAGYVGYSVTKRMAEKYPESRIIVYDSFVKARLENFGKLLTQYKNIELIPWEKADIRDEKNYDLVLDTTSLSKEEVFEKVLNFIKKNLK